MSARALLDTNVLIYGQDVVDAKKHERAIDLMGVWAQSGQGALSAQVLGEYICVVSRKLTHVLDVWTAMEQVKRFAQFFTVYDNTLDVVLEAARGMETHGFSYYDAQIWAVAKLNGIPLVLSEDFTHGCEVEGVRFENPFLDCDSGSAGGLG